MVEPYKDTSIPVFCYLSENEIVNSTYGEYICLMFLTRLGYLQTREGIIEEWCISHWASEVV